MNLFVNKKQSFIPKELTPHVSKKLWNIVNTNLGRTKGKTVSPEINLTGKTVKDHLALNKNFANYF